VDQLGHSPGSSPLEFFKSFLNLDLAKHKQKTPAASHYPMHAVPLRAHQLLEASRLSNEAAKEALIQFTEKERASQRRTVIEYQYPVDSTSHIPLRYLTSHTAVNGNGAVLYTSRRLQKMGIKSLG
jgi:hypothetical protein